MPVIFYTEEEYKKTTDELIRQGLSLAQHICKLEKFHCIVGVGGNTFDRCGSYCYKCPAEYSCPYPYKKWPK